MEWALRALRLIAHRASLNGREDITLDDIEWAIQELEREAEPGTLSQQQGGK